jgi:hypothetical protein
MIRVGTAEAHLQRASFNQPMTPNQAADLIDRFVAGSTGPWDWDDFVSAPHSNPRIQAAAKRCARVPAQFPPTSPRSCTSDAGAAELRRIAAKLRE